MKMKIAVFYLQLVVTSDFTHAVGCTIKYVSFKIVRNTLDFQSSIFKSNIISSFISVFNQLNMYFILDNIVFSIH